VVLQIVLGSRSPKSHSIPTWRKHRSFSVNASMTFPNRWHCSTARVCNPCWTSIVPATVTWRASTWSRWPPCGWPISWPGGPTLCAKVPVDGIIRRPSISRVHQRILAFLNFPVDLYLRLCPNSHQRPTNEPIMSLLLELQEGR